MSESNDLVKRAVVRSGEHLFATQSFASVTDAQIVEGAGLSDAGLVAELFVDKMGLLRAIIDRHQIPADARRNRVLDDLVRRGKPSRREAAEALVYPLSDKMSDPHGGRDYLLMCARLRLEPELFDVLMSRSTGSGRAVSLMMAESTAPEGSRWAQISVISAIVVNGLADCAHRPEKDHRRIVKVLIDSICAVVGDPTSPEPVITPEATVHLVEDRA